VHVRALTRRHGCIAGRRKGRVSPRYLWGPRSPAGEYMLTRFHGVFVAHARLRAAITPGGRGPGARKRATTQERPTPRDIRMNWARRLKRVFGIEIEQCVRGGGRLKVIASIEEAELIERILTHRRERGEEPTPTASLGARAPPQASLF